MRLWASEAGMTCNPSVEDRFGWDFLLEMNVTDADNMLFDQRAGKFSFFIQVKTTQKGELKRQIKLSNWEYLVKEPIPTFAMLVQLDDNSELIGVYLTHIGEAWIKRTLKKLRRISGTKISQVKMTFKAEPHDRLSEPYPLSMKERLLESINGDYRKYCTNKIKLVDELGYTEFRSHITLNAEGKVDDFVDFAIGTKKGLPVKNVIINDDIRFGVPGAIKELDAATMEIPPPAHNARLVLSNDAGITSEIEAKVFLPNWMITSVPDDKFKFRVESSICEGVFGPKGKATMVFNLYFELEDESLDSLLPIANAVLIFSNTESQAKLSIYKNDHRVLTADIDKFRNDQNLPSESLVSFATMISDLNKVCTIFETSKTDRLDFYNLYRYKEAAREMRSFIDYKMRGQLSLRFKTSYKIDESREVAVPRLISLPLGDRRLVVEGVYIGLPRLLSSDKAYESMSIVHMDIRKSFLLNNDQKANLMDDYKKIVEEYQDKYNVIDFSDNENTT